MSVFSAAEVGYLRGQRRLARIATVGPDSTRTSPRSASPTTPPPTPSTSVATISPPPRSTATSNVSGAPPGYMAVPGSTQRPDEPRQYLVDPAEFGVDPDTPWHPVTDGTDLIACYWQHLAVCVLRETCGVHTSAEVARRVGIGNVEHLDRQLSGAYRIRLKALIIGAVTLGDITLLPQVDSIDDLYPPGAR